MSCLTTPNTSGLGYTVSKFPLGICSTKLIALGTAVTIREPLSTLLVSHSVGPVPVPDPDTGTDPDAGCAEELELENSEGRAWRGAKCARWAVVVKMRKLEAIVKEFTLDASSAICLHSDSGRGVSSPSALEFAESVAVEREEEICSLPLRDRPIIIYVGLASMAELEGTRTRMASKQNSGNCPVRTRLRVSSSTTTIAR